MYTLACGRSKAANLHLGQIFNQIPNEVLQSLVSHNQVGEYKNTPRPHTASPQGITKAAMLALLSSPVH